MNIIEYFTIRAADFNDLDKQVNTLLASGFQPFGRSYVIERGKKFRICQAMVKEAAGIPH
jgi:hypothetical protein